MINYYQPFLLPFLHFKPYRLPTGIHRHYYLSWEDALWDLLIQKNIPKGSTVLIPDFYCMDVVENIKNHGYSPVFYPLNDHFQIDPTSFAQMVQQKKPKIIIIFHACGITSALVHDISWLSSIDNSAIILEDCVHRLLDPTKVKLIHTNHVVMDSLRKDSPLPGSFIYGSDNFLSYQPKTNSIFSRYYLQSTFYFILFRMVFVCSVLGSVSSMAKFAHEVLLKRHDDIIGDSLLSHRGLPFISLIHRFINFQKVKDKKIEQVNFYSRLLSENTLRHPDPAKAGEGSPFYSPSIPQSDYQHLHVYPLGIRGELPENLLSNLHKKGIIVWNKFPDSPWSRYRQILFLPLGFHISKRDIEFIAKSLKNN